MMKFLFANTVFFLCFLRFSIAYSADIRIGLYYNTEIQSAVFTVVQGEYMLVADNKQIASLGEGMIFHIDYSPDGIVVNDTARLIGTFNNLEFRGISSQNVFLVKPIYPSLDSRESDDDLLIGLYGKGLQIINRLDLEKYVAGTIEAEGGTVAHVEYYKAQAVLARTYAVKNFTRHAFEGFNLCDGQHCQAFKGKSRWNKQIYEATLNTENEVLTDSNDQLANAAYHANCGGLTSSAAIAWNEDLPYLVPVSDPFCLQSDHAQWKDVIPVTQWREYLLKRGVLSPLLPDNLTAQPARQKDFVFGDRRILISDIRQDLQLKSSYLTISLQGSNIVLNGRGYGHGVGLCQEGAMEMARLGYVYVDILMFYFRALKISQYQPVPGD